MAKVTYDLDDYFIEDENGNPRFQLKDNELKVLNLKILYPDMKDKEIRSVLRMGYKTYRDIVNKPAFIKRLQFEQSLPALVLQSSKGKAARTLYNLLEASSEQVRFKVAATLLNKELTEGLIEEEDTNMIIEGFDDFESDKETLE